MPDYDINELAVQMGVPRRTIRYYVEIGLLPPPEGAGRAATYGDEHLDRLAAIKRLQSQGLTLEQIRDALSLAPPAQDPGLPLAPRRTVARSVLSASESSAAAYLAQVRQRMESSRHSLEKRQPSDAWQGEPWTRIRIDADTELHVRRSSTKRISRIVRELRRVLAEDPEGTA